MNRRDPVLTILGVFGWDLSPVGKGLAANFHIILVDGSLSSPMFPVPRRARAAAACPVKSICVSASVVADFRFAVKGHIGNGLPDAPRSAPSRIQLRWQYAPPVPYRKHGARQRLRPRRPRVPR